MPPDAIAVTGLGLISSLGHDVVTSCAAARAGIRRVSELETFAVYSEEEMAEVAALGHRVAGYADGFEGVGRLVRLGSAALADLLAYAGIPADALATRTRVYLNLGGDYHRGARAAARGAEPEDDAAQAAERRRSCETVLLNRIAGLVGASVPAPHQAVSFGDHAGLVNVLWDASRRLLAGETDRCVVGALDSCVDPAFLAAAAELGLVAVEGNEHGFTPGEAAAFVLLERLDAARARGARIEATLEGLAAAKEAVHRFSEAPSVGVALAGSIGATLDGLADGGAATGLLVGDLNGDPARAAEWGYAIVRALPRQRALGEATQWFPATWFGETGAAAGLVALCMVVRGFARGYAGTEGALVWLSSDDGAKGSFHLRRYRGS